MQLGDFLNKLASKAGIDVKDPMLVELLSSSELAGKTINPELVTKIDQSLMTIDAATAHSEVRKRIKAETLNGADKVIEDVLAKFGLDEEAAGSIKKEANTFNKIPLLVEAIAALESKKSAAKGGADKEAITKQIDDLNSQIRSLRDSNKVELDNLTNKHRDEVNNLMLKNMLSSYEYSLPEAMKDSHVDVAHQIIANSLAAKGVKIVMENGQQKLQKIADGTPYYNESNVAVSIKDFADSELAAKGLLVVNGGQQRNQQQQSAPHKVGGAEGVQNMSAAQQIDAQLGEFQL